jgi:lipopolysaccharide cholinephosphotransferase
MGKFVSYEDSKYVADIVAGWRDKDIVEKSCFGTPVEMDFENIKIYCPEQWDKYLTTFFGDYMQLPPEEKRVSHHQFISYDLNKSYLDKE